MATTGDNLDTVQYKEKLRTWLRQNIFAHCDTNENRVKQVLENERSMGHLINCFTHESFSATENYERYEAVGDGLLAGILMDYMFGKFPDATQEGLTSLKSYYGSGEIQSAFLSGLGAEEVIRTGGAVAQEISNILGDVFEAIFHGIYLAYTSAKISRGVAYDTIVKLFGHFYNTVEIDRERMKGDYKTRTLQLFNRFFVKNRDGTAIKLRGPIEIEARHSADNVVLIIFLGEEHFNFLQLHGVRVDRLKVFQRTQDGEVTFFSKKSRFLLKSTQDLALDEAGKSDRGLKYGIAGIGPTKSKVQNVIYKILFNQLADIGFGEEGAKSLRMRIDLQDDKLKPYLNKVQSVLDARGLKREFRFDTSSKMSTEVRKIHLLTGFKRDGTEVRLMSASAPKADSRFARIAMVKALAENKPPYMIKLD